MLILQPRAFSTAKLARVRRQVSEAQVALDCGFADYFLNRLDPPDTIRVLPHFLSNIAYLDIETSGLRSTDWITTIALHGPRGTRCFVRGRDLIDFLREARGLSLLVTYNGSTFDLPKIRREFGIDLGVPHLDLKPCLQALGYSGSLKRCEELLGIRRCAEEALTGREAVELWRLYEANGDEASLRKLVRYNVRDALSLELLAIQVYNRVMANHPACARLPRPTQPRLEALPLSQAP
jgi:uncharacterized protein YprB with RNaseH-like and TPR domain